MLTVFRNEAGDRYWYFQDGRRFSMSPALALSYQRRGLIRIKTKESR